MRKWLVIFGLPLASVLCAVAIFLPVCRGLSNKSKIINAVKLNNFAAVESLLDKGVNVNSKNSIGETLLIISIENKCKEITNLLLEKGADVNIQQDTFIVGEEAIPSYFKELVSKPIKPTTVGGRSALHWAVVKYDMDLIETLLAKGANIDAVDAQGQTPLHCAIIDGQTEIIKLLLSRGANVNIKDFQYDHTPLHYAVTFRYGCKPEIINLLLEHGADIDAVDKKGLTPVCWACYANHKEAFNLLISKGANVNLQNAYGATLLHLAASRGDGDLVKILLSSRAKLDIKDNDGKTPLDLALQQKHTETADLIMVNGGIKGGNSR
jgi:ankyrin repeat protein